MIELDKIECKVSDSAFVGIKKDKDNKYKFFLPKGFDEKVFNDNNELKKELFYKLFELQKKYMENQTDYSKREDGIDTNPKSGSVEEKEKPIFYVDLALFDLINSIDDTEILGLNSKITKSDDIDYSQIDKYIEEALFAKNHAPIIIEAFKKNLTLEVYPTDIIGLYCYIYTEILNELNFENEPFIKELAEEFKNKYLAPHASLFKNDNVVEECKDILENIEKNSLILEEFQKFYDAIYHFLYHRPSNKEEGIIAGIDNFYSIWEELCLNYVFNHFEKHIKYADVGNTQFKDKANSFDRMYCKCSNGKDCVDIPYPFQIEFNGQKTTLYPDLVVGNLYKIEIAGNINYKLCDEDLDLKDFIESYKDKKNFYYIGIEENIWKKLLNQFTMSNSLNKKFEKLNSFYDNFTVNNKKYVCISTYISPHNKKVINYPRKEDFKKDFNWLKQNLKIEKIETGIYDFKYKICKKPNCSNLKSSDCEIDKKDIIKQKIYELALDNKVKSIFVLPKYSGKDIIVLDNEEICGITIQFWNFKKLLEEYLK